MEVEEIDDLRRASKGFKQVQIQRMSNSVKKRSRLMESESTPEYEVERILDCRNSGSGRQYLIKWRGFPDDDNTWENAANLSCKEKLKEFMERREMKREKKKQKRLQKRLEKQTEKKVKKRGRPSKTRILSEEPIAKQPRICEAENEQPEEDNDVEAAPIAAKAELESIPEKALVNQLPEVKEEFEKDVLEDEILEEQLFQNELQLGSRDAFHSLLKLLKIYKGQFPRSAQKIVGLEKLDFDSWRNIKC